MQIIWPNDLEVTNQFDKSQHFHGFYRVSLVTPRSLGQIICIIFKLVEQLILVLHNPYHGEHRRQVDLPKVQKGRSYLATVHTAVRVT